MTARRVFGAVGCLVNGLVPGRVVAVARSRDYDAALKAADVLADREAEHEVFEPLADPSAAGRPGGVEPSPLVPPPGQPPFTELKGVVAECIKGHRIQGEGGGWLQCKCGHRLIGMFRHFEYADHVAELITSALTYDYTITRK